MIMDKPTTGSSFSANSFFLGAGFFNVPREIVDEGFETGKDAECDIVAGRVGLGLASGELGWLDPHLMASIFRQKEDRFWHVSSLEACSAWSRFSRLMFLAGPFVVWNKKLPVLFFFFQKSTKEKKREEKNTNEYRSHTSSGFSWGAWWSEATGTATGIWLGGLWLVTRARGFDVASLLGFGFDFDAGNLFFGFGFSDRVDSTGTVLAPDFFMRNLYQEYQRELLRVFFFWPSDRMVSSTDFWSEALLEYPKQQPRKLVLVGLVWWGFLWVLAMEDAERNRHGWMRTLRPGKDYI